MSPRRLERLVEISLRDIPNRLWQEKIHWTYILDKNYRILSVGHNGSKTHPAAVDNNYPWPCLHSELQALVNLPYGTHIHKCRMINIRLSRGSFRTGRPIFRMSKPCEHCLPWVLATKFKEMYFTSNDGFQKLY